ncbi:MAG: amidohydrolase family protein [Armatimonadota bacterium]
MSILTPLVQSFLAHGRVEACPIIDMHTHPDRFHSIYFPDPEIDGILRTMDRCNVRTIAIAPHFALADPVDGNTFTITQLHAYPERFRGYWCYNPRYPETLERAKDEAVSIPGMIGYKVHPTMHNVALTAAGYQSLFEWANAHRLVVLAHTWDAPPCNTAACRWVAKQYPEMVFLLGHSIWGDFDGAIGLAKEFPNVYLELTAAERMPGFITRAVREAGSHKILFGTDLPWFDPNFTLGCVLFSDITDEDRHAILHGNAERLLMTPGE